jgi:hypothetical protein
VVVPLAPETLERLEEITSRVRERGGVNVEPMQLAALLLEKTARQLSEAEAEQLPPAAVTSEPLSEAGGRGQGLMRIETRPAPDLPGSSRSIAPSDGDRGPRKPHRVLAGF